MIIVVHSDYLGYILIRHLNHNTRFTMDFLCVQFHSTIKQKNKIIKADIIVSDNWDHSKKVAIPKTFYSYAYILQQSGRKKLLDI